MTRPVFRVTVRGKFADLPDASRAALADCDVLQAAYTEPGTFTHDGTMSSFTFRCEVPAAPDDDENTATAAALDALTAHGHPHEVLRVAVTDMREIRVRRKQRRRSKA